MEGWPTDAAAAWGARPDPAAVQPSDALAPTTPVAKTGPALVAQLYKSLSASADANATLGGASSAFHSSFGFMETLEDDEPPAILLAVLLRERSLLPSVS
ncbi:hypothetical protein HK405_011223 [Cladochytrium tenue]|nr:hypothetical protein HK405_011223 [Cladochytrium tenue]